MPYEEHDLTAPDGTKLKTYLMLTQEKRVGEQVRRPRPPAPVGPRCDTSTFVLGRSD
jgi:hypothetical protein